MINLSRAVRLKSLLSKDEVNQLGRHKVSKYLYHLTNAENYKKIQESGMLKTTKDGCFGKLDGNFMIELKTFLRTGGVTEIGLHAEISATFFLSRLQKVSRI